MGQHHALGVAGSAGGEHDLDEVVGGNLHRVRLGQATDGDLKLLEGDFGQAKVDVVLGGVAGREGQLRGNPRDDALDVVRGAAEVERHRDDARPQTAEEDEHPLRRVRAPDDDLVSLSQSPALEKGRYLPRLGPEPVIGPAQVAETRLEQEGVLGAKGIDAPPEELNYCAPNRVFNPVRLLHFLLLNVVGAALSLLNPSGGTMRRSRMLVVRQLKPHAAAAWRSGRRAPLCASAESG